MREPIAPFGSTKPAVRSERPDHGGRFGRDRDEDRPRRSGERPFRARDELPAQGARDERGPSPRAAERRPLVWRDEDGSARKGHKTPRRGADPKAERAASAERPRERVGAIEAGEGRKVVVERLVSEPRPERERPARTPSGRDAPRRPAPSGEDRPRRRDDRGFGDRKPRGQDPDARQEAVHRKPRGEGYGGQRSARSATRAAPRANRVDSGARATAMTGLAATVRMAGPRSEGRGKGPGGFSKGPRGPGRGFGGGPGEGPVRRVRPERPPAWAAPVRRA